MYCIITTFLFCCCSKISPGPITSIQGGQRMPSWLRMNTGQASKHSVVVPLAHNYALGRLRAIYICNILKQLWIVLVSLLSIRLAFGVLWLRETIHSSEVSLQHKVREKWKVKRSPYVEILSPKHADVCNKLQAFLGSMFF